MKVLMLSNSDGRGGAYAAAFRLLQGLEYMDVECRMLVAESTRNHRSVKGPVSKWARGLTLLRPTLDTLPLLYYRERERTVFSLGYLPDGLTSKSDAFNPDLVNLHWVTSGFLRIETLGRFKRPIVWTLHDMWPFTGGCHYGGGCGRYKDSCGLCPQLKSKREKDISRWVWNKKNKAWQNLDITVVTPSRWLAERAKESSLFRGRRVEVIPNGLDTELYKPIDKMLAREILLLPKDKKLILFGAVNSTTDRRKGFHFLEPAFKALAKEGFREKAELVIFGASEPAEPLDLGMKTSYMGKLGDDYSKALLYSAADVFVVPSIEDNLPCTVMESLACATPVVGFNIGGIPDMVHHQVNGYLAEAESAGDLARGMGWVLEDQERSVRLNNEARERAVKEYSLDLQARRYRELYEEITKKPKGS